MKLWKCQLYLLGYASLALVLTPAQQLPEVRTALGIVIAIDAYLLCWSLGLACQGQGTRAVWQALRREIFQLGSRKGRRQEGPIIAHRQATPKSRQERIGARSS